jgi:hypothetical protein
MFKFYICLVDYGVVLLLYRWWIGCPLVYRFLLGMVDTKHQRRNNTTPTSPPTHVNISNIYLLHRGPQVLHHQGFRLYHEVLLCPELLHRTSKVLLCPSYITKLSTTLRLRLPSTTLQPTLSQLIPPSLRSTTTQSTLPQQTTLPRATQPHLKLPSINTQQLLVLCWTETQHWCSTLLHHKTTPSFYTVAPHPYPSTTLTRWNIT